MQPPVHVGLRVQPARRIVGVIIPEGPDEIVPHLVVPKLAGDRSKFLIRLQLILEFGDFTDRLLQLFLGVLRWWVIQRASSFVCLFM